MERRIPWHAEFSAAFFLLAPSILLILELGLVARTHHGAFAAGNERVILDVRGRRPGPAHLPVIGGHLAGVCFDHRVHLAAHVL